MELKQCEELIMGLDSLASIIANFGTSLNYIDMTSLASRYYISIHDVVLPVAIEDGKSLTYRSFFEPIANIYLHEHKAYAILKNLKEPYPPDNISWNKVAVIDLMQSEKFMAITAASIAEKVYLLPTERSIVKILPSNLRTYVDTAYNIVRKIKNVYSEAFQGRVQNLILSRKPIEMTLWLKKASTDIAKEITFLKGVSLKAIKISFTDYEIEIKMYRNESLPEIVKLLERLTTSNTLLSMIRNIERVTKILFTAINLIN